MGTWNTFLYVLPEQKKTDGSYVYCGESFADAVNVTPDKQ
jgi:hypothetical protein